MNSAKLIEWDTAWDASAGSAGHYCLVNADTPIEYLFFLSTSYVSSYNHGIRATVNEDHRGFLPRGVAVNLEVKLGLGYFCIL